MMNKTESHILAYDCNVLIFCLIKVMNFKNLKTISVEPSAYFIVNFFFKLKQ